MLQSFLVCQVFAESFFYKLQRRKAPVMVFHSDINSFYFCGIEANLLVIPMKHARGRMTPMGGHPYQIKVRVWRSGPFRGRIAVIY
jgi:hypothetical protein